MVLTALVVLVGTACPLAAEATAPEDWEHWYRVDLVGQRAGWMVDRQRVEEARLVSESETEMRMARGGTEVAMAFSSQFVESLDGEPISMQSVQQLGGQAMRTETEFVGDEVVQRTIQGEETTERRVPRPKGDWWTPGKVRRFVQSQLGSGAERFSFQTLDPLAGLTPITVESTLLERSENGHSRWSQTVSTMPGVPSTVEYDAEGQLVSTVSSLFGMEMVFERSDRETAQATKGKAPELMVNTLVRPNRPIRHPRLAKFARYRLALPEGALPTIPNAGAQTARVEPDGSVEVTVDLRRLSKNSEEPSSTLADTEPFLLSSPFLDHQAKSVRALLRKASLPKDAKPAEKAEALRALVHRAMARKDLETAFATASEAASELAGDCTEHAVLLSALLRAEGIPARVASGLLYVERFVGQRNIFGFHLWSQAWLDGRWVDLDAMTPKPFDATHIALGTSALNDQEDFVEASTSLTPLMGALVVEVLEVGSSPPGLR